MPSKEAIEYFGRYDYNRLVRMGSNDVLNIKFDETEYKTFVNLLRTFIQNGRIKLMDKENGCAWEASGVIGYKDGELLIFHER